MRSWKRRTCNAIPSRPGRPPHSSGAAQCCVQGAIARTVADAAIRHAMPVMLIGRVPPVGFGRRTTKVCSHDGGMLAVCRMACHRSLKQSHQTGGRARKCSDCQPSPPAALPRLRRAAFRSCLVVMWSVGLVWVVGGSHDCSSCVCCCLACNQGVWSVPAGSPGCGRFHMFIQMEVCSCKCCCGWMACWVWLVAGGVMAGAAG